MNDIQKDNKKCIKSKVSFCQYCDDNVSCSICKEDRYYFNYTCLGCAINKYYDKETGKCLNCNFIC